MIREALIVAKKSKKLSEFDFSPVLNLFRFFDQTSLDRQSLSFDTTQETLVVANSKIRCNRCQLIEGCVKCVLGAFGILGIFARGKQDKRRSSGTSIFFKTENQLY